MKKCSIVIGSLFGDEGKGHMTDILCDSPNTINVRFNGGAQAAHTVVTPDGKRHAFRHFGAGTFAGAVTYLTEDFLVNPISFVLERDTLKSEFNIFPREIVNPNARVTTLWDMYINQGIETYRGARRHGSCGMGINETVERSMNPRYKLTVFDLLDKIKLREKLKIIQGEYVEGRLKEEYGLSISDLPGEYPKLIAEEDAIEMFMFFADEFVNNVRIFGDGILLNYDNVVFEGAQGLLLDQNNPDCLPEHCTTSNTGVKNAMKVIKRLGKTAPVDIYYMSRCYMTRHGAGPLMGELLHKPYENVVDLTNLPNEFQGSLRFGYMDFDLLAREIKKDLKNISIPANVNIAFTCLDQLDASAKFYQGGYVDSLASSRFLQKARDIFEEQIPIVNGIYATSGLTRREIIQFA